MVAGVSPEQHGVLFDSGSHVHSGHSTHVSLGGIRK